LGGHRRQAGSPDLHASLASRQTARVYPGVGASGPTPAAPGRVKFMLGIPYNTLIVLIGVGLLGASAGLVGCFATLRRRALTGDALAHAALPGVCLAFLAWGE